MHKTNQSHLRTLQTRRLGFVQTFGAFFFAAASFVTSAFGQVDFSTGVVPLFSNSGCTNSSCHGTSGGLTLSGAHDDIYFELVSETTTRVQTGNASASFILRKPSRQDSHSGFTAPIATWEPPPNTGTSYSTTLQWIQEGAYRYLAPTPLSTTAVSTTQINLTWVDRSNGETRFRIERKVGTGAFVFLTNTNANVQSFNDAGLTPGTTYTYQIRAENNRSQNSNFSNQAAATTQLLPSLTRTPANMFFTAILGSTTVLTQPLQISNGGGGTLNWNLTDDQSWITLNPSSGSSTGEMDPVTVTVNPAALPVGTHTGTITINATGASNSPQTTMVQLSVLPVPVVTDFLDDFSDGIANGWSPLTSSRWRVDSVGGNNAYCLVSAPPNADEFTYLGTTTWDDFVMELDARSQVNGNYFILFNARNTTSLAGYYLQFRTFGGGQVNLWYGCGNSPCVSIPRDFVSNGQYHRIRIERKKPSIKVFVDGQFVFEHMDSTYTVGYIGFGAYSDLAHFDNVKIAALTSFSDINATALTAVNRSAAAWGDYDNDNRMDLLLTGEDASNNAIARIFRNTGAGFSNVTSASLRGVKDGAVAWGDYDNDGDLDVLLSGNPGNGFFSEVYRNTGAGSFTAMGAGLRNVRASAAAWGDYDNDGDLDVLLSGASLASTADSVIFRNDRSRFVPIATNFTRLSSSAAAWGDYDKDGDLDVLLTGFDNNNVPATRLYQNTDGNFSTVSTTLTNLGAGAAAWGDYDSDGDLDLALTGRGTGNARFAKIYRNTGTAFEDLNVSALVGVEGGAAAWGDYDNDGDLDLFLTGLNSANAGAAKVYHNISGNFLEIDLFGVGVYEGSAAAWGDYDNDHDLDLLLAGRNSAGSRLARVYRNNSTRTNLAPSSPPLAPAASVNRDMVTFTWASAVDDKTAAAALTNNLRVGTTPGGNEIVSAMADANGARRVPRLGNTNHRNSWTVKNLTSGTYYWAVQALDNAFAGSRFTGEQSFVVQLNRPPTVQSTIGPQRITLGTAPFRRDLATVFQDPDGDRLTYRATSSAPNIARADTAGSILTVTAIAGGSAEIAIIAEDGKGGSAVTSFTITINRPPAQIRALENRRLLLGGSPITFDVTTPAIFNDPDGDALSFRVETNPPNLVNASFTGSVLTLAALASGSATITIFAEDNRGGSASASFIILVNRAPRVEQSILPQTLLLGGAPFSVNLETPAIFSDPDGDVMNYNAVSSAPTIARVEPANKVLTVTALAIGNAQITVTADDGKGATASTFFAVTVVQNHAPTVANAIPNQTLVLGAAPFVRDLNAAPRVFADPDGDVLFYSANSNAPNVANPTVTGSVLTVTALAGGSATIILTADDHKGGILATAFTVAVNRAPAVLNPIAGRTITLGAEPFRRDLNNPAVFEDPDGDLLVLTAGSSADTIATATINAGILTVTAVRGGNVTITLFADDRRGGTTSNSFTLTVNRPPQVSSPITHQTLTLGDAPFTRDLNFAPVVFTDPDGDLMRYTATSNAPGTALASVSNNILSVTAVGGGTASITITADDGRGGVASTEFILIVNRAPVVINAIEPQQLLLGGAPFVRDVNSPPIFSDPDGDALHYTVGSSDIGVAVVDIRGSLLTVSAIGRGSATITIKAEDGRGGNRSLDFLVTVQINGAPSVINPIADRTLTLGSDALFTRDLEAAPVVFHDPEGDALIYKAGSSDSMIVSARVAGRVLTVKALAGGSATILVEANDGKGGTAATTFKITVNRPPVVFQPIANRRLTLGGPSLTFDLNAAPRVFNDPDGDTLAYFARSHAPAFATANVSGTILTLSPVAAGIAAITIRAEDNKGGKDSTVFSVTVEARPFAPANLNAAAISSTGIILLWEDKSDNETGFTLERKKDGESDFSFLASTAQNKNTYHDPQLAPSTKYTYRIFAVNSAGNSDYSNEASATTSSPNQVGGFDSDQMPTQFMLAQNSPNPFNPATRIRYGVPQSSEVTLTIYSTLGQVVRVLVEERQAPGYHDVKWDGRDDHGNAAPSGVYIYVLRAGQVRLTRKMLYLQ